MLEIFGKYRAFKVLAYFFEYPSKDIHIKELGRKLDISPTTAKNFCEKYEQEGILNKEKKGNSIFFSLKNEKNYVKELKRIYAISKIREKFKAPSDESVKTIALYGSHVEGDYTENSDIDILILSRKKQFDDSFINKMQKKLSSEINVTNMTYMEWNKQKRQGDNFVKEVLNKHFLLYGEEL
ncbi:MAG: nucleotidyltransferase domain-containing protein [Candidatus Pacearchaeota archaeon]